jgi:hypothetical protein
MRITRLIRTGGGVKAFIPSHPAGRTLRSIAWSLIVNAKNIPRVRSTARNILLPIIVIALSVGAA